MEERPNNLLEARKSVGLSRSKVAEETLYRYENGTQCPNVYVAIRLSEYYHRTVEELFPPKDGI